MKSCSCFFTDGKQDKAREYDAIPLKSHASRSNMAWLLYNLQLDDVTGTDFENKNERFRPIKKGIVPSMYNNLHLLEVKNPSITINELKRSPSTNVASYVNVWSRLAHRMKPSLPKVVYWNQAKWCKPWCQEILIIHCFWSISFVFLLNSSWMQTIFHFTFR